MLLCKKSLLMVFLLLIGNVFGMNCPSGRIDNQQRRTALALKNLKDWAKENGINATPGSKFNCSKSIKKVEKRMPCALRQSHKAPPKAQSGEMPSPVNAQSEGMPSLEECPVN